MPLPYLFAAATAATGAQLDANFQAVGLIGAQPVTVAGTNSLVMTLATDTVTVSSYSELLSFAMIATATNTGAVVAQAGALPSLPVYKDTPTGPVLLTGGEIVTNNLFGLTYDAALNAGGGGFHLSRAAVAYLPVTGGTLTGPVTGTSAAWATLTVGGGTPVKHIVSTLATITYTSLGPGLAQDNTVTLTGAGINDSVEVGLPASITAGIIYQARVSAASIVTLRAQNVTAGTVNPTGGVFRVTATGF